MRIWKIVNEELFNKAMSLYKNIQGGSKMNKLKWKQNVPFEWEQYYEQPPGFNACTTVLGVLPKDPKQVLPKGWRMSKDRGAVPDVRTKEGKAVAELLEPVVVYFEKITDALNISFSAYGRFTIPKLYRSKDKQELYLVLGREVDLSDDTDYEEVTESYVNKKLKNA